MSLSGLLIFAGAYFLAVVSPGPGVAAFVARVLARGRRGIAGFIGGFIVGDLIWFAFAAAGMAALAQTYHTVFVVVKWLGAAYLLFLAFQMWTSAGGLTITSTSTSTSTSTESGEPAQDQVSCSADSHASLFIASLTLTLGNPKAIMFFMALLPTIVDLRELTVIGAAEIAGLIVLIMAGTLAGYAFLAERARRFITSARHVRAVNRTCAAALAGAAVAVSRQ
jgi:threonine/homoserine/homoserine lactone efflux protein